MARVWLQTLGGGTFTAAGTTGVVALTPWRRCTLQVTNGAGTAAVLAFQGSMDNTNFQTIAYGTGASAAYTQSALTIGAGSTSLCYLPPDDMVHFIRGTVTTPNNNGTRVDVIWEEI